MRLYVGNLSFDTLESELEDAFTAFGTVSDVKIMMDHSTNRSRGFGFVTMGSAAEGEAAMKGMDGNKIGGRSLTVNEARPREERPRGSYSDSRR